MIVMAIGKSVSIIAGRVYFTLGTFVTYGIFFIKETVKKILYLGFLAYVLVTKNNLNFRNQTTRLVILRSIFNLRY